MKKLFRVSIGNLALALFIAGGSLAADNALYFTNTRDIVEIGHIGEIEGAQQLTMEFWVKYAEVFSSDTVVGSKAGSDIPKIDMELASVGTVHTIPTAELRFFQSNATAGYKTSTDLVVYQGEWFHLAWVFDGSQVVNTDRLRVYLNGQEVDSSLSGTIGTTISSNLGPICLGCQPGSETPETTGDYFFVGSMDEVRIWTEPRTQQEIIDNMYHELSGNEDNLLIYYDFNQGTGDGDNTGITELIDRTSNNYNGLLHNFALTGSTSNFVPNSRDSAMPALSAGNIFVDGNSGHQMTVSWDNGSGSKRAVFAKQTTTGSASPVNDSIYMADAVIGSGDQIDATGWYCVYNGTGKNVTINGLSNSTDYRVMVCEYNGAGGFETYNATATELANIITETTFAFSGPALITNPIEVGDITATSATLGGNILDENGFMMAAGVIYSTISGFHPVTEGIEAINPIGAGGEFTITLNQLTEGTTYYYRAFAANTMGDAFGEQFSFTPANTSRTITLNVGTNGQVSHGGTSYAGNGKSVVVTDGDKATFLISSANGYIIDSLTDSVDGSQVDAIDGITYVYTTATAITTDRTIDVSYGEPGPPPEILIDDAFVAEGDSGTITIEFVVSLSEVSSNVVTVDYTTSDGTATAEDDYTSVQTTLLSFNPGEIEQTVTVQVTGDGLYEGDETFNLNLSNASNATISDSQGIGTIIDDDILPDPPAVTGMAVTNDPTPTWIWTSGGGGNGTFRQQLDAEAGTWAETTETAFTPPNAFADGGIHILYVQERDAAGNWSPSGSFAIEVDLTPPDPPAVAGTPITNDTTPTWSWITGGGGNGTFRHQLDTEAGAWVETTENTLTPAAAFGDGETHILYVQERDAAGNWSPSGSLAVEVDVRPPNPPVVTGAPITNDTTPAWSWITGGGGNGTFRYQLDTEGGAWAETTESVLTPAAAFGDGETHILHIQERDAAGNWSPSGSLAVEVDTTPPNPPAIAGAPITNDTTPTWNWVSGGGNGIFRYQLDSQSGVWVQTTAISFTPDTGFAYGETHTLYIQERDEAGNWSASDSAATQITPPTIVVGTLTDFGGVTVNTSSQEQSYNVSGAYLFDDITITAPNGFEIATSSDGPFTGSLVLTESSGTVQDSPIYVRFDPTTIEPYSGNILHQSQGAGDQTTPVRGSGIKADQAITFGVLEDKTYGDPDFTLTATSDSGLSVTYTSSDPDVAAVDGSTVTIRGAGSAAITASQGGDGFTSAATDVAKTLTIHPKTLTVTADSLERLVGKENPELTIQFSGWVYNEGVDALTAGPVAATDAIRASLPNAYDIIPYGGSADNYALIYVNGTLTVAEAVRATIAGHPTGITNKMSYDIAVGGIGVVAYRYRLDQGDWSDKNDISDRLTVDVYEDGAHTLSVIGRDSLGNWQWESDATVATWTVDATPPAAKLTYAPRGTIGLSSIDVIVVDADVRFYKYRLIQPLSSTASAASSSATRSAARQGATCINTSRKATARSAPAGSSAESAGDWSDTRAVDQHIQISELEEGSYRLEVIGLDATGNWQEEADAAIATWIIDSSVPTAVMSGLPDTITGQTSSEITVDGDGISRYRYNITGPAPAYDGTWSGETDVQNPILFAVADNGSEDGEYTLTLNAGSSDTWQDGSDGTSSQSATVYTWTVDTTPPDLIVDLSAVPGEPASSAIELTWSAIEEGQRGYLIWYADTPITESSLNAATEVYSPIIPGAKDHIESFTISGLAGNQTYYFAVRSIDATSNSSAISNSASATTSGIRPTISDVVLTSGGTEGDNSSTRELTIIGENFIGAANGNIIRFSSDDTTFDIPSSTGGSSTSILADVPAGAPAGDYRVRIINRYGTSALSDLEYSINSSATDPLPEVRTAAPAMGRNDLWTLVEVEGNSFDPDMTRVTLGAADGTILAEFEDVQRESTTRIRATVPIGVPPGRYHVQVHHPDGRYNWVSAVTYEVYAPIDICVITGSITSTGGIDVPDDGVIWYSVTLSTDNRPEIPILGENTIRARAILSPGTVVFDGYDVAYTDAIDSPRQVPLNQEMKDQIQDQLNSDPLDAVVFTMGSPTEALSLGEGQTIFVELDIAIPSSVGKPTLYYFDAGGDIAPAGIDGSRQGRTIEKGGTALSERVDVPEAGYTTYTLGLLIDHMSTFGAAVAGSKDTAAVSTAADSEPDGGGSGCFITVAAGGTPRIALSGLFACLGLLFPWILVRRAGSRPRKQMIRTMFLILIAGWVLQFHGSASAEENGDETGSSELYSEAARTVNRMPVEAVKALDKKLSKALIAYYDGEFSRALPLFREVAEAVETMDILFWMGMSARHIGEYPLAIERFKKMLANDPNLSRVRLELATAYFLTSRFDKARSELKTVSAAASPLSVQRNVEKLLAKIEAKTRRSTWTLSLSQRYMWDDNISRSTAERELDIFGGGFAPDETFTQLSGEAHVTNIYGSLLYDIGKKRGWMWSNAAAFSSTIYHEYSEFNLLLGDVNAGLWYFWENAVMKIPLGFAKISYGSDQLSYIYHMDPSIEYYVNAKVSLKGLFSYCYTNYYEHRFTDLDNDKFRYELSSNVFLADRKHIFSLAAGFEDADAEGGKYAYDGYYGGVSYFAVFPGKTEALIRYQWMKKDYPDGKALPLYDAYRNDERQSVSIRVSKRVFQRASLSFSYSFARNDSNLALYTYERQTYSVNLGIRFGTG